MGTRAAAMCPPPKTTILGMGERRSTTTDVEPLPFVRRDPSGGLRAPRDSRIPSSPPLYRGERSLEDWPSSRMMVAIATSRPEARRP
jgi:hypothetical protein